MFDIVLSFLTAFMLTYFAIPSIIKVARVKGLFDEPGERRSHTVNTPSLGGIAIFAGTIFSIVLWTPFGLFGDLQYILCAFLILFLIGARDDIIPVDPYKKLAAQILAAAILVFKSKLKLSSLYGIFGIYDIPEYASITLTIFTIIVIINAFNLIDGINGLSGSIGVLISVVLGTWFFMVDRIEFALIAFALTGSLIAFLKYNFSPAEIFMGDTGSLLIGLACAILTIEFVEYHKELVDHPMKFKAAPAVAIGILILPLFDTMRVFATRIMRGNSPFHPDRRHIHHLLIDAGMSHMQATSTLLGVNLLFIIMAFKLHKMGSFNLLLLIFGLASALTYVLHVYSVRKKRKQLSA